MSVEAITWALKQPVKPSSTKFVLVVLANCASGDTFLAYPSAAYLVDATGQDRKTVLGNLAKLAEWGLIEDTGKRTGLTRQIPVWRVRCSGDLFTAGAKASQKRDGSENGTVPKTDGNSTVFPEKESQKRDTETSVNISNRKAKASVQRAARFDDFWSVYPNKKGKQEAEKRWRKDGLDAIADQIIAHVRHMAAHDDAWRRGFEPMGSTYLNQARWTDEARGAPLTASQQPGKQLQGLMALEGMKHGVVPQRDHHGYPEIGLPRPGAPAIGGSAAGDGVGVAGGAGQRLALGPGRGRAEDSRGVLDLGPDSYRLAESAEDA